MRLLESFNSLRQNAVRLQAEVDDLHKKLEFWNKAQFSIWNLPESTINAAPGSVAGSNLLQGPELQSAFESVYPLP